MKNLPSVAIAVLSISLIGFVRPAEPTAAPTDAPASAYGMVEAMIGGVWSTTVPAQDGSAAQAMELRFTPTENKQGVVYQSWLVKGDKRVPYQNGIYAWNAAKGNVEFFSTDARGSLTEGSYTLQGNVLMGDFTIYNKDGSSDPVHTQVTQATADVVTEQVFLPNGDNWKKASDLRLERHH